MNVKRLSVFFPAYNEEGNIPETVNKAVEVLDSLNLDDWEILVVDDGSSDKTLEISQGLSSKNPKIRVHHQVNGGYGAALRAGFYNTRFEWVVYTDGDGQFDFSEITRFLDKTSEAKLILGYRVKRKDPFYRIIFQKGWALSLFIFFGLRLKDVDCGFKLVSREVLSKIPKLESTRGGMINAELAIKTSKFGFNVSQVGVTHYPRKSGKPTGANIGVIIESYLDLLRLWWKLGSF